MKIFSVSAIIVLYNENLFHCMTYNSFLKDILIDKSFNLIIYDNSYVKQHEKEEFDVNITYIHDPQNSGLSKAYNIAARHALNMGKQFILLLDQDTFFPVGAWNKYLLAIKANPYLKLFVPKHKIANGKYLSPVHFFHKISKFENNVLTGIRPINKYAPINSGMLISLSAFWEVGGYNENVKLDFSDFQFIERFSHKFSTFYVLDVECIQNFSDESKDENALLERYIIFCQCIRSCKRTTFIDKIDYFILVLKRTLSLSLRCRSVSFIKIFLSNYMFVSKQRY